MCLTLYSSNFLALLHSSSALQRKNNVQGKEEVKGKVSLVRGE
jgi:hypothetical protein